MALRIEIRWHEPVMLRDGSKQGLIYAVDDLEKIPAEPGIYVFARRFGDGVFPLRIGKTTDLRRRIRQHLHKNVRLMQGLKTSPGGDRLVLLGEVVPKKGQQLKKVLDVLERTCLETALAQGHELLSDYGTKTRVRRIASKGKKAYHKPFPRRMNRKVK